MLRADSALYREYGQRTQRERHRVDRAQTTCAASYGPRAMSSARPAASSVRRAVIERAASGPRAVSSGPRQPADPSRLPPRHCVGLSRQREVSIGTRAVAPTRCRWPRARSAQCSTSNQPDAARGSIRGGGPWDGPPPQGPPPHGPQLAPDHLSPTARRRRPTARQPTARPPSLL